MKLYTFRSAPNPRRVHIFLAEKGVDVPEVHVDILKGESRKPEYRANVNKMGGIPVLELDDGTHIAESVAICRYLEALHPTPALFGTTPEEQGRIEMWVRRIELNFMMPVGMVWVHGSPLTARVVEQQIAEVAELNRKLVRRYFGFLDEHLSGSEHLAGEAFSMADILALCTADFADQLNGLKPGPEHEHLARWYAQVSSRPSVAAAAG